MRRRRIKWTWEQVYQQMRELADDGAAPSKERWDQQRGPKMPSSYMIVNTGRTWAQVVEAAGLKRAAPGSKLGSKKGFKAQPVPAETEAFIQHAFETAEPPRPTRWPIFGIPTRTQTFRGRLPDGTPVQVTRQYYSLR